MEHPDDNFSLFVPFTRSKAIGLIIILGTLVFFNMLFNQFVWDDLSYIQFNPDVHSINLSHLFRENSFNNSMGQYRALTATYFAIVYSLFGQTTFFYHLFQLSIHIVNTILIFLLFGKLFNHKPAFFLSLIFLVHPIQVESVSFIGATGNPLFFLYGTLALLLAQSKQLPLGKLVLIASLLLLSLLTKETGMTFVFLITLYGFLFNSKNRIKLLYTSITAAVIYGLIRVGFAGIYFNNTPIKGIIPINSLSLSARLLNLPAVITFYLKTFFYPRLLVINQQWIVTDLNLANFYFPLFCLIAIFGLLIFFGLRLRKNPIDFAWYLFFLGWFLAGLFLHSQVIPLDATVADRWFYFSLAGLLGLVGFILKSISIPAKSRLNMLIRFSAVLIILLLSLRSMVRNTDWVNNLTLFSHDTPLIENYEMEDNLGSFLSYAQKYHEALPHTLKSTQLYPYDVNLSNLAYIYERLGNFEKAKEYYQLAIRTQNTSPSYDKIAQYSYFRWARLYLFYDDLYTGKEIITQATDHYPENGIFWAFRAASEYLLGDQTVALLSAARAKTLLPNPSTSQLYDRILHNQTVDIRSL